MSRQKVEIISDLFLDQLRDYVLIDFSIYHFKTAILDSYKSLTETTQYDQSKYLETN